MLNILPNYIQVQCRYVEWKTLVTSKNLPTFSSESLLCFEMWAYDIGTAYVCEIFKGEVPYSALEQYSQEQNDADKADYLATMQAQTNILPIPAQKMELDFPKDVYGRPEFRRIVTRPNWLYSPKSLDFYTAKYDSLYNRKHYGAGYYDSPHIPDSGLQFFDATDTELIKGENELVEDFQARITANCIKTILSWENPNPYDVQGALLYISKEPVNPAWLWCIAAPDVPEEWGGSKPFMGRGMNLCMMAPKIPHIYDAVSANTVNPDPVYHSGKISIIVKHGLGEQIGVQFIIVCYEG